MMMIIDIALQAQNFSLSILAYRTDYGGGGCLTNLKHEFSKPYALPEIKIIALNIHSLFSSDWLLKPASRGI